MEFEGKIYRKKNFWIAEIPSLDLMTQGKSRKNALEMIQEAALGLIGCYFESEMDPQFDVILKDFSEDTFGITSTENKLFLALFLRRKKEQSGSSVWPS